MKVICSSSSWNLIICFKPLCYDRVSLATHIISKYCIALPSYDFVCTLKLRVTCTYLYIDISFNVFTEFVKLQNDPINEELVMVQFLSWKSMWIEGFPQYTEKLFHLNIRNKTTTEQNIFTYRKTINIQGWYNNGRAWRPSVIFIFLLHPTTIFAFENL